MTMETTDEVLVLKQRQLQLKRQRLQAIMDDGLKYYKPHAKQESFHAAGVKFKRRMMRSGNRFGKSTMGAAEDCAWLRGERAWLPEGDPARRGGIPQHKVKLLVITTDWSKVDEVFTSQRGGGEGKLWKFLPSGFVKKVKRNHDGVIDIIECVNGSLIRFDTVKSWKNNPQATESTDWDAIHIDEPCPEGMWKSASRGLIDRHGSAWFTLTPLTEFWINDLFFPEDTEGQVQTRSSVWAETGTTYDNPYLTHEAIKEFENDLTEEERQCRILGIPLHLSGLIYKEFSYATNVLQDLPGGWSNMSDPPKDWPVYFYIDPHPQTPHCVLFLTISPFSQPFYFNDIYKHCTIEELSGRINEVNSGRRVIRGRIDPLAYINDPITDSNMAEEFARHGVYVEKATKALEQGILATKGALKRRPMPIMFSPACRRTLWEIQRYCWDEGENRPLDKDDHAMECLYRSVLDEPTWIAPPTEADKKPVGELIIRNFRQTLDEPVTYAI